MAEQAGMWPAVQGAWHEGVRVVRTL